MSQNDHIFYVKIQSVYKIKEGSPFKNYGEYFQKSVFNKKDLKIT